MEVEVEVELISIQPRGVNRRFCSSHRFVSLSFVYFDFDIFFHSSGQMFSNYMVKVGVHFLQYLSLGFDSALPEQKTAAVIFFPNIIL